MGIITNTNHFAYDENIQKLKEKLQENITIAKLKNKNYKTIKEQTKRMQKLKKEHPTLSAEERIRMQNCCGGKK